MNQNFCLLPQPPDMYDTDIICLSLCIPTGRADDNWGQATVISNTVFVAACDDDEQDKGK